MSKAVMTIHGFLTDTNDFGRLYDYLDMYDEVFAYEVPGHNGEVDFTKFTVESVIESLLSRFDELSARHDFVDLVGFSMGGALTSYLCCKRKVNRAVMIAPSNKYFNVGSPIAALKFFLKSWKENYAKTSGRVKERIAETRTAFKPFKKNVATASQIAIKRILPNVSLHTFNVFRNLMSIANKVVEEFAPVSVPSLVMWGELDELVPFSTTKYLSRNFSDIAVKTYDNIGHAMLLTNLDNVLIPDIVEFLTEGKEIRHVPPREE